MNDLDLNNNLVKEQKTWSLDDTKILMKKRRSGVGEELEEEIGYNSEEMSLHKIVRRCKSGRAGDREESAGMMLGEDCPL